MFLAYCPQMAQIANLSCIPPSFSFFTTRIKTLTIMIHLQSSASPLDSCPLDINTQAQTELSYLVLGDSSKHVEQRNRPDVNLISYWNFYVKECTHALHDGGRYIAIRKHTDVVEIATQLQAGWHYPSRDQGIYTIRTQLTA